MFYGPIELQWDVTWRMEILGMMQIVFLTRMAWGRKPRDTHIVKIAACVAISGLLFVKPPQALGLFSHPLAHVFVSIWVYYYTQALLARDLSALLPPVQE